MLIDEFDDWSDIREMCQRGSTPISAAIVRRLLAERDTLLKAYYELDMELTICRRTSTTNDARTGLV